MRKKAWSEPYGPQRQKDEKACLTEPVERVVSGCPLQRSFRRKGSAPMEGHVPVLLNEVMDFLRPQPAGRYLDGTLGLGGHSIGIMRRSDGLAELLGLDQDAETLALAGEKLAAWSGRTHLYNSRFSRFSAIMDALGWEALDGAMLDLGVSSPQLDQPARGFSFLVDGPLDMRMDPRSERMPAWQWLNQAGFEEIRAVIQELGEDPLAGRIARAIVKARNAAPITRTLELAEIVRLAYPPKMRATARNHPATRVFQAVRLKINDELGELSAFLEHIADRLKVGARLAIISFHSLEDRIVKNRFRDMARICLCPPRQSLCSCGHQPLARVLTKKPVTAGPEELASNIRSRSAKLRALERL